MSDPTLRRLSPEELETILGCVPVPLVEHQDSGDGKVILLVPRFRAWPGTLLMRWLRSPRFRTRLDAFGSFAWSRCDGRATVEQIAAQLPERFPDRAEQARERTAAFFRALAVNGLVELRRRAATDD